MNDMEKWLMRVVIELEEQRGGLACHYNDVVWWIKYHYGYTFSIESIPRMLRSLRSQGYLYSPKRGYFGIGFTTADKLKEVM